MLPIEATDRARRLGNVAAILIDLARRAQAAESGWDDGRPTGGVAMDEPPPVVQITSWDDR